MNEFSPKTQHGKLRKESTEQQPASQTRICGPSLLVRWPFRARALHRGVCSESHEDLDSRSMYYSRVYKAECWKQLQVGDKDLSPWDISVWKSDIKIHLFPRRTSIHVHGKWQ